MGLGICSKGREVQRDEFGFNGSVAYDVGRGKCEAHGSKVDDVLGVVGRGGVVGVEYRTNKKRKCSTSVAHTGRTAAPRNIIAQSAVTRRRVVSSEWPSSDARVKESGSTGHISPALRLGTRWSTQTWVASPVEGCRF